MMMTFDVEPTHTFQSLKQQIADTKGFPLDRIRLINAGKKVEDNYTFDYYKIKDEALLHMTLIWI